MQKKNFLIAPILFLYYEESVCPLLLKYNKVYFESSLIAKPNLPPSSCKRKSCSILADCFLSKSRFMKYLNWQIGHLKVKNKLSNRFCM